MEAEETLDALYIDKDELFRLLKKTAEETNLFETLVDDEPIEEYLDE